jgi:hypothetical protein
MTKFRGSQVLSFRLILIDNASMRVLGIQGPQGFSLPCESIPVGKRVAQALTESIRRRFGFCTMQLAVLPKSTLTTRCAIFEILETQPGFPASASLEILANVPATEMTEEERDTVGRIMTGQEEAFGRFGRLCWIEDLQAKAPVSLVRASIRQVTQGINFCLMSFRDTTGASFWFKAVGEPNVREFAITEVLARLFPAFVPRIAMSIPEWNGWIAEHAQGTALDNSLSLNGWVKVLKSLTSLQEDAAAYTSCLSAAGATDCRCAYLRAALDPFIEETKHAMHRQTSIAAPRLSDQELDRLGAQVAVTITILEESGIPDTLLHRDIGHGNVFVSHAGATFLDWAEAGIGHPFLSAEHLLAGHECLHPLGGSERQMLRDFYTGLWQTHGSSPSLGPAAKAAPAVAALAYGIDTWHSNSSRRDPEHVWPFLRAIARRAKRELETASGSIA